MKELGAAKLTEASVTDQPLTAEEKALLEEVYSRLEVFEQDCREYHTSARICRDILRLKDPFQDAPDAKEKTLQLQTLKSTFNNCIADQMENMPEARLLPELRLLRDVDLRRTAGRHLVSVRRRLARRLRRRQRNRRSHHRHRHHQLLHLHVPFKRL